MSREIQIWKNLSKPVKFRLFDDQHKLSTEMIGHLQFCDCILSENSVLKFKKMNYSNQEKLDMIEIYFQCRRNGEEALRQYRQRFPNRPQFHRTYFRRLAQNLGEFGSFTRPRQNLGDDQSQVVVLAFFRANPRASIRDAVRQCGYSFGKIQKILKANKFKDFKILPVHHMKPEDANRRLTFCRWLLDSYNNNNEFLSKILFTDESQFTNCGVFNRKNEHHWDDENPHDFSQVKPQTKFSINVWCGILGNQVIGPFFFNGTLNSRRYLDFLENNLPELLEDVPLAVIANLYFQQDGAPPHNAGIVLQYLRQKWDNKVIATNGPVLWPARSPDLTPLDFFLWGYLKNEVYKDIPGNERILRRRIENVFQSIDGRILGNVETNFIKRVRKCVSQRGGHIEHLL